MRTTKVIMPRQLSRIELQNSLLSLLILLILLSNNNNVVNAKPFWMTGNNRNNNQHHHHNNNNNKNRHHPHRRRWSRWDIPSATAVIPPSASNTGHSSSSFIDDVATIHISDATTTFPSSSSSSSLQQQQQPTHAEDLTMSYNNNDNYDNYYHTYDSIRGRTSHHCPHQQHHQQPNHDDKKVEQDWELLISRLSGGGNNKLDRTNNNGSIDSGGHDGSIVDEEDDGTYQQNQDGVVVEDWNVTGTATSNPLYQNNKNNNETSNEQSSTTTTTPATVGTGTTTSSSLSQQQRQRRQWSSPSVRRLSSLLQQLFQQNIFPDYITTWQEAISYTSSRIGPTFLTVVVLYYSQKWWNISTTKTSGGSVGRLSYPTLYGLALLGASCGFSLFLYFITVGYALGITLPVISSLLWYSKNEAIASMTVLQRLSNPTYLHSLFAALWGVRIFIFLVWREYVSWPALHQKVVEVQSRMDIPYISKVLCWLVYSFFYVALITPCWSRLEQNCQGSSCWGIVGYTGLFIQVVGLVLETVADWQKSHFKQRTDRHAWCHVGVWKWSTHPNYLGEGLFWWGTYLAHGFGYSLWHTLLATVGVIFITLVLKGSTRSLALKHIEKYGDQPAFCEFQKTHRIWGSKKNWNKKDKILQQQQQRQHHPHHHQQQQQQQSSPQPPAVISSSNGGAGDGTNVEKSNSWI